MPYAAISYRVRPGHEDELEQLFSGFERVDTPVITDADGAEVGRLLGTAVFVQDDVLVRVIHYEGDFARIGQHMGRQKGVHRFEERLAPFLAATRATDTRTQDGFEQHFRSAVMRRVSQLTVDSHPGSPA